MPAAGDVIQLDEGFGIALNPVECGGMLVRLGMLYHHVLLF